MVMWKTGEQLLKPDKGKIVIPLPGGGGRGCDRSWYGLLHRRNRGLRRSCLRPAVFFTMQEAYSQNFHQ